MVQSLEINYVAYEDIFCMFCGAQILCSEDSPTECPHVLFIATDEGYEYQSDSVKDILPVFDTDDEDGNDDKYFVDRLKEVAGFLTGSFIIESYAPAGTTDYAVAAFYGALGKRRCTCYLRPGTYLPMMYMPDAVLALIQVAEADKTNLNHRADFNVNAMSFAPEELAEAIKRKVPDFTMDYEIDPLRQSIADS